MFVNTIYWLTNSRFNSFPALQNHMSNCLHRCLQTFEMLTFLKSNSWSFPQTFFYINQCQLHLSSYSSQGQDLLTYLFVSHSTVNPTASLVSSTFKIYPKTQPFSTLPLPERWSIIFFLDYSSICTPSVDCNQRILLKHSQDHITPLFNPSMLFHWEQKLNSYNDFKSLQDLKNT